VPADEYPDVMDTAMVAAMLQMNIDTVRRLSRQEVIPAHRLPGGRSFRYLKDEVIAWLREQPANDPPADGPAASDGAVDHGSSGGA